MRIRQGGIRAEAGRLNPLLSEAVFSMSAGGGGARGAVARLNPLLSEAVFSIKSEVCMSVKIETS